MANTNIDKNEDGTVTFETSVYLFDAESNKYINAILRVPKALYDNNGTLFEMVIPEE